MCSKFTAEHPSRSVISIKFSVFTFKQFQNVTEIPERYISRIMFYKIYEKGIHIWADLKKAPKLTYLATHPGNKKQNVALALTVFDDTNSAAIKRYCLNRLNV